MWVVRTILLLVVVALVLGFQTYNYQVHVNVDLIRWEFYNVPMVVVVYWSFLAGMVVAALFGLTYVFGLHSDLRAERRGRRRLENEVSTLRNRTIEELDEL